MANSSKDHYITLQIGPIHLAKDDRAHYKGILTSLINSIVENIDDPRELKDIIHYFSRERLSRKECKIIKKLTVHQRNKTVFVESASIEPMHISSLLESRINFFQNEVKD